MPTFQYERHAVHCVLGSVSSNSNNSMLPTSESFLWFWTERISDWFCRRSCWRACRSGWFSIFWINSRTLVLSACFTTECGGPGIRKSMSASFSIVCSWLKLSLSTTGLTVFSRSVCISNVECFAFMTRTCWTTIWHIFLCLFQQRVSSFFHVPFQRWYPYCHQNERVWITLVSTTGLPVLSEETVSSWKELTSISWERDVCFSILHGSRVIFNNGSHRSLTTWIWNWLVRLETPR